MVCKYCKSEHLFLKEENGKTSVYCKNCGKWISYVSDSEKLEVLKTIERQKHEIIIDGADVERVKGKLRDYQKSLKTLNSEIVAYKDMFEKNRVKSAMLQNSLQEKLLKLKELSTKITAYKEVLTALGL